MIIAVALESHVACLPDTKDLQGKLRSLTALTSQDALFAYQEDTSELGTRMWPQGSRGRRGKSISFGADTWKCDTRPNSSGTFGPIGGTKA